MNVLEMPGICLHKEHNIWTYFLPLPSSPSQRL
jgi:hypothetical protein